MKKYNDLVEIAKRNEDNHFKSKAEEEAAKREIQLLEERFLKLAKAEDFQLEKLTSSHLSLGTNYKLILGEEKILISLSRKAPSRSDMDFWSLYIKDSIKEIYQIKEGNKEKVYLHAIILHSSQKERDSFETRHGRFYNNDGDSYLFDLSTHQCHESKLKEGLSSLESYKEHIFLRSCREGL